jgi:hypothetical protein
MSLCTSTWVFPQKEQLLKLEGRFVGLFTSAFAMEATTQMTRAATRIAEKMMKNSSTTTS